MSRALSWIFGIALALVVVGGLLTIVAPSVGGGFMVVGLVVLAPAPFVIARRAQASKGWTRAVNPGAARREHQAEQPTRPPRDRTSRPDGS